MKKLNKKYKILYDPQKNRYLIGFLGHTYNNVNYYIYVPSVWRNVLQADCKSIDDIVELSPDDDLTCIFESDRIW